MFCFFPHTHSHRKETKLKKKGTGEDLYTDSKASLQTSKHTHTVHATFLLEKHSHKALSAESIYLSSVSIVRVLINLQNLSIHVSIYLSIYAG